MIIMKYKLKVFLLNEQTFFLLLYMCWGVTAGSRYQGLSLARLEWWHEESEEPNWKYCMILWYWPAEPLWNNENMEYRILMEWNSFGSWKKMRWIVSTMSLLQRKGAALIHCLRIIENYDINYRIVKKMYMNIFI